MEKTPKERGKRKLSDDDDPMNSLQPPKPLERSPTPPILFSNVDVDTTPCTAVLQPPMPLERSPSSELLLSAVLDPHSPQVTSSISGLSSEAQELSSTTMNRVFDFAVDEIPVTPGLEPTQSSSPDSNTFQNVEHNIPQPLSQMTTDWLHYCVNRIEDVGEREDEVESDVDEQEINFESGDDPPVYKGAPITLNESLVSILTLALKFSLSGQCIQAILKIINLHCMKEGNVFPKSLFLFKKYFSQIQGEMDYEYYCSKCYSKCERNIGCLICEKAPLCCLIKLSMIKQLQTMFQRQLFFTKLLPLASRFKSSGISDIYDGKLYKDHVSNGLIGDLLSLSFMWYTDGASLYKSSKISVWPLFLCINELPYSERFSKENLLVPALWCGPVKPHGNVLLQSAYPDLQSLLEGVDLEVAGEGRKTVKGMLLNGTGDSPARALMLNMVLGNGKHSCQKCEQKGESREGFPGVRVFPYRPEEMMPRGLDSMCRYGELALMLRGGYGDAYMGLKGPSTLNKISMDPIRGTAIDAMHLIYGGLGKLHLKFFIGSIHSSLPCNVSKHRSVINERLLSIKPPHILTRVPKSIEDLGIWNTSQHKSMFLYYSLPVFKGIIPEMTMKHFASLVAAIQLLNADCVTSTSLVKAEKLITKYLAYFEDLYNKAYMTLNVHLLSHLVDLVKEQGPLWVTACFPLESVNGIILHLVHGTRYPEMQIATSLQLCLGLQDLVDNLSESDCKEFCENLLQRTHKCQSTKIGTDRILGQCEKPAKLPEYLIQPLKSFGLSETNISTFNCLRRQKNFYAAESYMRSSLRDSSSIVYCHEGINRVGLLKTFLRSSTCSCTLHCSCVCTLFAVIQELEIEDHFPTLLPDIPVPNIHSFKTTDCYVILPTSCLHSVCIKMVINDKLYIAQRCNQKETE